MITKLSEDFNLKVDSDIEIRLVDIDAAQELFELIDRNRNHIKSFLDWVDHTQTVEDSKAFIQKFRPLSLELQSLTLMIWYQSRLVGMLSLNQIQPMDRKANIGYWIGKEYEGKGIITKSVKRLIQFAFVELELHRLEILCATSNERSQNVPIRLGFEKEGTLKEAIWNYDKYFDAYLYGLVNRG